MSAPPDFEPLAELFPFADLVGPIYVRRGSDPPVIGFEPGERHTNHRGTIMGGMLATLVDLGHRDHDVHLGLDDHVRAFVAAAEHQRLFALVLADHRGARPGLVGGDGGA